MNVLKRSRGQAQLDCGITQLSIKATLVTIDPNLPKKIQISILRVE